MDKTDKVVKGATTAADLVGFIDQEPFWVIWQIGQPARGGNRIRRISQNYNSAARAEADAVRYRKSGTITWVEESRPEAPSHVPAEAMAALRGDIAPAPEAMSRIGSEEE